MTIRRVLVATLLGASVMLTVPGPATAAATAVSYGMTTNWGEGFQSQLTVVPGEAVTTWTIEFDLAAQQEVRAAFHADFTQTGRHVVLFNRPFNGAVPAGGMLSVAIQIDNPGLINVPPAGFTVNGQPATYTPQPYLLASVARGRLPEGGTLSFNVRITQMPTTDITVEVGSGNIGPDVVVTPRTLTFVNNPRLWNTPQTLTVTRPEGADTSRPVFIPIIQRGGKPAYAMEAVIIDPSD
ncbi:cellulose binding domain-containing protein [Acrocarpospora catenulata]|uniref:cellulose binding domain-containing protein n=1 Tax=Acrocarpospora catenulata TaxID=2836182 RepID=UPI001BDAB430|nr:cellulose binding domain-containing protein [Acrocarpospora catenulata]